MIKKRLFGTPIIGDVKKKLEDRQYVAENAKAGESISFNSKDNELGLKTPFVRMWTSLRMYEPEIIAETLLEIETFADLPYGADEGHFKMNERQKAKRFMEVTPGNQVLEFSAKDTKEEKIFVKTDNAREEIEYARKVYIIGDYNYQTNYGEVNANDSLDINSNVTDDTQFSGGGQHPDNKIPHNQTDEDVFNGYVDSELIDNQFPQRLKNNPLLKPQAGITSVTSETEGTLGVIKKTTVKFIVHNFYDYDRIYNQYFLKPGATIFVDFGWSNLENLYNPDELINSPNIKEFLYGLSEGYTTAEEYENNQEQTSEDSYEGESAETSSDGVVTRAGGDLEVLQGLVTDYDSKILPNGSVECSVTITSANSALLGFETNRLMSRKVQNILNHGVKYLGVKNIIGERSQLDKYMPNINTSTTDTEYFNEMVNFYAQRTLTSVKLTPGWTPRENITRNADSGNNSIRSGVFISSLEVDDVYITWGWFEDYIINSQFGFGENNKEIREGNKLQVRMDSSNSFTTYDDLFLHRQQALSNTVEAVPAFVYPLWWGNSDPGFEDEEQEISISVGSYSYQSKKSPIIFYPDASSDHTSYDKDDTKKRIPMREVFINTDIIKEAFNQNTDVRKVLTQILEKINKSSSDIFDWKMISGDTDSEIIIIDNNWLLTQQRINGAGVVQDDETGNSRNSEFDNLFTFNIMSKKSMVKNYDLTFKLPSDNIGNMYAIQAMSHDSAKLFPTSKQLNQAIGISAVDGKNGSNFSIVYEPDNGDYRASQIGTNEAYESSLAQTYENATSLIDDKHYKIITKTSTTISNEEMAGEFKGLNPPPERDTIKSSEEDKELQDRLINIADDKLTLNGFRVVNTITDYFKLRFVQEIKMKRIAGLLPYNLSLTIYGIATLQPGDTFRVDYLPIPHLMNTYVQTMKVSQQLDSTGWFTTLETQYRIKPESLINSYGSIDRNKIRLSPLVFDGYNLQDYHFTQRNTRTYNSKAANNTYGFFNNNTRKNIENFRSIWPYMTHVQPPDSDAALELQYITVLTFTWDVDVGTKIIYFPSELYYNMKGSANVDVGGEGITIHFSWAGYISPYDSFPEAGLGAVPDGKIFYNKARERGREDKDVYGISATWWPSYNYFERNKAVLEPGKKYNLIMNGKWWAIASIGVPLVEFDKDVSQVKWVRTPEN